MSMRNSSISPSDTMSSAANGILEAGIGEDALIRPHVAGRRRLERETSPASICRVLGFPSQVHLRELGTPPWKCIRFDIFWRLRPS
jgi:hypothetical protein